MKSGRGRLSRMEVVLLTVVVLLPIPLFAHSGMSIPLPGVVERGIGDLVTIDAADARSGASAARQASENGRGERRSDRASLRITPGRRAPLRRPRAVDGSSSTASDKPAGESGGGTPAGKGPEGAGDDDGDGSPGSPESAGHERRGSDTPSLNLHVSGQGSTTGLSVDNNGLDVDVLAENGGAGTKDASRAEASVSREDGSRTGVGVTVPGAGAPLP